MSLQKKWHLMDFTGCTESCKNDNFRCSQWLNCHKKVAILYFGEMVPKSSISYMTASSNGNIFHVTGLLWEESTGHRWILVTKASDAEFYVLFDLRLKKLMSKQSRRRWFVTAPRSLWRRSNGHIQKARGVSYGSAQSIGLNGVFAISRMTNYRYQQNIIANFSIIMQHE